MGYDGFGRKLYETPPVSSVTYDGADKYKIFTYDAAGRLTMVMLPEVPNPDNDDEPEHPIYRYYYDVYGNQVGILDPLGRVTVMEYDSQNRPVRKYQPFVPTTLPENPTTADILGIDLSGKLYEETTYDPHGRVEQRVDYEGHTTVYRYYVNDVTSIDHFMSGTPLEFRGIPGQLRVEENYDGVPDSTPDGSIVYTYDKLGRKVKEVKDTTNTYEFSYDDEGRILILESPQGDLYYEYDPQTGRKVSTASYPSTMTFAQILADATATPTPFTSSVTRTVNTYDDLGRLETVQVVRRNGAAVNPIEETTYTYNKNGSQAKVKYSNGVSPNQSDGNEAVYEYDALNRLYRLSNYRNSGHLENELLSRFEYSCYADGQRARATETCKGWKEENSIVQEVYLTREMAYRYDGLGRLIWEQRNDHDPNSFTYDLVGNRIKQVIGGRSNEDDVTTYYGYNGRDQLQWEGLQSDGSNPTITYLYDYNGSLTSQTQGAATTTYVYDLRNRLQSVTGDSITTTYGYSPDGIRVRRQIGTGTPTVYLVDPMNLTGYSQVVEAWEGGATPTMTYTIGGDVIAQAAGTDVRFLIYDGHGSVRNHANSTGALMWFDILNKVYNSDPGQTTNDTKMLTYDAWGQECNGLSGDGLYYTGEMYDTKLSMYNLRARWYSPATGRFNAVDPYSGSSYDPQSLHKYLYCHADPINGIDPSGRFSRVEIAVTTAIIAFVGEIIQPAFRHIRESSKRDRLEMELLAGITFLSQDVQKQMQRDLTEIKDPYELSMTMEFYHEFGGQQKAITLYNHRLEENALSAIDACIEASSWANMGLGLATGIVRTTPIYWCEPHPPRGPEHWKTIVENAMNKAAKGEAKTIYTGRYLSTITNGQFNVRMAPDIAEVLPNGKIRILEVVSPKSQTYNELLEKGWRYKQVLGDYLEYYNVINVGELAP